MQAQDYNTRVSFELRVLNIDKTFILTRSVPCWEFFLVRSQVKSPKVDAALVKIKVLWIFLNRMKTIKFKHRMKFIQADWYGMVIAGRYILDLLESIFFLIQRWPLFDLGLTLWFHHLNVTEATFAFLVIFRDCYQSFSTRLHQGSTHRSIIFLFHDINLFKMISKY